MPDFLEVGEAHVFGLAFGIEAVEDIEREMIFIEEECLDRCRGERMQLADVAVERV